MTHKDSALHSSRPSRLKKRFHDILSGSVKLDPRGATLFLEGLCAQDDPVTCLNSIMASSHGLSSVQSAMLFDLSIQFMNGLGSALLEYLLRACDVGGNALDNLSFHVVEPPIFWAAFVRAFQQGALNEDAQLVFARVLSRLLTLQDQDTTPYRDIVAHPSVEDSLVASSNHEIRAVGHLIKHILSNNGHVTLCDALNGPGGRHDNDHADYHDIAILPTAEEIMCRQPPFLRPSLGDELSASDATVNDYLDNTFRMLREDMLFKIREEMQAISQMKEKQLRLRVTDYVSIVGVYTGTEDRKTRWGVKLQSNTQMEDEDARVDFLTQGPPGLKILKHQSLVCLVSGQNILSLGRVNRVEELLALEPPVIVIQLDDSVNIRKSLVTLSTSENVQLVQLNTITFSFEPVLTALQKMCSVPLATEILFWNPETPVLEPENSAGLSRIVSMVTSNISVDLRSVLNLPASVRLDKAQARSLIAGLTKRLSLIQGPPGEQCRLYIKNHLTILSGTGKSFIGTILAKAMHDKTSNAILIVCYTNHALDQFLEDLIKFNIPAESIVRLGRRANQSVEHLSLHKQSREHFQYDWDEINNLKYGASSQEHELETHFDKLLAIDNFKSLITYLELRHPPFFDAFYVPLETEDRMTRVGRDGKPIDEKYLFSRWTRGRGAGVLSDDPHVQATSWIWAMDHPARKQLLTEWRHELATTTTESICKSGIEYNKLQDSIGKKFQESIVAVLKKKRIIACTTTGAAIYTEAIKKVGPRFLLVEEAGEILESHTLTALSPTVDQIILIGDHKYDHSVTSAICY